MAERVELIVSEAEAGQRLDAFLAAHFPDRSRVRLQQSIHAGGVLVDGTQVRAAYRVREGNRVAATLADPPPEGTRPEEIPLSVLYEDEHLAVVDKPPGMVVHPAKGHWRGTLAAAVQFRFGGLSTLGGPTRPGIVHRLDRDTSGVILVAKHDRAHQNLAEQFAARTVEKEYLAVVVGRPTPARELIDRPIGSHPYQREKMAIRHDHTTVREAQTFYETVERFAGFAAMKIIPQTGRTHQIRVHLASIGCPVLCDRLYGSRARISYGELMGDPADDRPLLTRQALHARRIRLAHPATGKPIEFEAPIAGDIESVLTVLREHRKPA
ncbi:MAG: RluA family pseudouridine synthase [Pirellulales bacterium]